MKSTAILINEKDRPTEVALLLQSLRTQTNKDFDVYILDDCGGTPLTNYHFFNCLVARLKLEGNQVFIRRTAFPHGVSRARQAIVDWAMERNYEYYLRVDDDVILDADYIERLRVVVEKFDIASGVTPPMHTATFIRDHSHIKDIINRVQLSSSGEFEFNGDDCGIEYISSRVLPAHHFRSCALMKHVVLERVKYFPTKLSMHGFREEQIFSFSAIMQGFTIGVDTGAIA
jgi:GT2 family glycosyltransferase